MNDYTTPPHLAIRVLWRLDLAGHGVEAWLYPTMMYEAVLIRIDGRTANIRQWKDREAALRWAEAVRGVYASFGEVLPGAERLGPGDDAE